MVRCLILALALTGCGLPGEIEKPRREYRIDDPEFQVYIDKFEDYSQHRRPQRVTNLVMRYGQLKEGTIGLCTVERNEPPLITIDVDFWVNASDIERETLVLHELGHCILRRAHWETVTNGVPDSIMFPSLMAWHYQQDMPKYQKELFSVANTWLHYEPSTDETYICGDH